MMNEYIYEQLRYLENHEYNECVGNIKKRNTKILKANNEFYYEKGVSEDERIIN